MKHLGLFVLATIFLLVGVALLGAAIVEVLHHQTPSPMLLGIGAALMAFAALLAAPAQSQSAGMALRKLIKGDSAGAIALPQVTAAPEVSHDE